MFPFNILALPTPILPCNNSTELDNFKADRCFLFDY